jgi:proteasome lid subunit RPN8/RPN11
MGIDVRISTELLAQITAEAARSPDVEVCGLLLGTTGMVEVIEPCTNVAADPARRFEIEPVRLLGAHRRARAGGPAVVGHYHSHPTGTARPSPRDAADAAADGSLWLIVGGGEVTAWRAVRDGEVEGRFTAVVLHPS